MSLKIFQLRAVCLAAVLSMPLALAACGGSDDSESPPAPVNPTPVDPTDPTDPEPVTLRCPPAVAACAAAAGK